MKQKSEHRRVLVLGLDCVPPALVFDWWAEDLPKLTALREANDKAVLSAWSRLSRQHVQLNGLKPTVSEVDLGSKGVFRRLRAGPFESRAAAHSTCQALQAANQKCFVVKN